MNETITLNNDVATLDIERTIGILSLAYARIIAQGKKFSAFPAAMLWGQPGVGKSQAVRQIGQRIEKATGKKVHIVDVRLLLFNPIDLRGIPVANEDKTLAVWLKPKIFQMDESEDVVNILFLDEISAAPQSVQSAAYQITLDRTVGEHRLPENCIVIAAGNRITDKSVAYKIPKALANRLLHFDVTTNVDSWRKWAVAHDIHPMVIGFLAFKPDHLNRFNPREDALAFATPRSWEMVSHVLTDVSDNVDQVYDLIKGLVGKGVASEFRTYVSFYDKLPDIADIFAGKVVPVPKDIAVSYAIVSAMVDYAKQNKDDLPGIANSLAYASGLPRDFQTLLIQDYLLIDEGLAKKIMAMPELARWRAGNASLLNGASNGHR